MSRDVTNPIARLSRAWVEMGPRFLPFADATSPELPLTRLLRLSLFQFTAGLAIALLNGTLNRVMIVELNVPAWLVSTMLAVPLVLAPLRVLIGHRSDTFQSALGWRRVPFVWFGTLLQFGGLAIMPFALLLLAEGQDGKAVLGHIAAALSFLLVGLGLHTAQTAGLALATDQARPEHRPRLVASLYVMLLAGIVVNSIIVGTLLEPFSPFRLIQVIQGAALATMVLNCIALWQQEARRRPGDCAGDSDATENFLASWRSYASQPRARRFLATVGLGTLAFTMQDVLLEPYGGEVLGLSVGETTLLTGLLAAGTISACLAAATGLRRGVRPLRIAACGTVAGLPAFACVIFAEPLGSAMLFRVGATLIGLGGGLFAVGCLCEAMARDRATDNGLAIGAWSAMAATAAGVGIAAGGLVRDAVSHLAVSGALGSALHSPAVGYSFVYHIEIALLFATLVALGPLVRYSLASPEVQGSHLRLAQFPG